MQGKILALVCIRNYLHFSSILSLMKQGSVKNLRKFALMLFLAFSNLKKIIHESI